jgi:3-methyladenine DNA glycosylase AlkC
MANESLENKLPKDRKLEALPKEPIENYTMLEGQSEQNVLVEAQIQHNVNQIQEKA